MPDVTLTSGPNELKIDPDTGRVAGLRHADTVFVAAASGDGPLRLHLPLPDFEAHMVEGRHSRPEIAHRDGAVVMDYADLAGKRGPTGVSARVEVRSLRDGAFELRCTVHNQSPATIPQVFFPCIGGFGPIDGEDDTVTFGKSRVKPWERWAGLGPDRRMSFMHHLSRPEFMMSPNSPYAAGMKWMDYHGRERGVSLFSREKTSSAQQIRVSTPTPWRNKAETIDLSWYFYPFIEPGGSWTSPDFVLYPHAGDWRRGVLKFKEHADKTYTPVASTPDRDATIGQFTLWISWHYQDWQDLKYTFRDIPAIAAEARAAGFREMTVARATALDFCLPHVIRRPLGTAEEFREAVTEARRRGVNVIPFTTCHIVREDTIGPDRDPAEWYRENAAGQRAGGNWTYDPHMTPNMPIAQLGSRAGYYMCPGSKNWHKAFFQLVEQVSEEWGCRGLMFDQSMECGEALCFNPHHGHRPDETITILAETLAEARRRLAEKFGDEAVLSGEVQWDASTEWMNYTWDWFCLEADEFMAPFFMAFPRARQCLKCTDYRPQINRIFASGYWLDIYLEEGGARLGDWPELTAYLASLAVFKQRFSPFFNRRDFYLYTLGTRCSNEGVWARAHRCGDETLVLACQAEGHAVDVDLELDPAILIGRADARLTVWSRTLEKLDARDAAGPCQVKLTIPAEDFVALHVRPQ